MFIGLLPRLSYGQNLCSEVFEPQVIKKILVKKESSLDQFYSLKNNFLQNFKKDENGHIISDTQPENIQTDIEKLAFFEAYADYSGQDLFSWIESTKENKKRASQFAEIVSLMDFNKPISPYKMEKFLLQLYSVANEPPTIWKKLIGPGLQDLQQKRIDLELMNGDLLHIFKSLGIVRNNSIWEKIKTKQKFLKDYEKLAVSAVMNLASFHFFGTPILFIKTNFAETHPTSKLWPVVTDVVVDRVRRGFYGIMAAVSLFQFIQYDVDLKRMYTETIDTVRWAEGAYNAFESPPRSAEETEIISQSLDTEIYKFWRTSFAQIHHYIPDPLHSDYDLANWIYFLDNLPKSN